TENILFICGGAFDGIEQQIGNRMNTQMVGFAAQQKTQKVDKENLLKYIAPQDLKAFGLIPEIVGRLPILTHLDPLDRNALRNILTEPKNALIKQYIRLMEMDGVRLTFTDEALDYIVEKALEYKLGARGLRGLCETIMMDVMFEVPSSDTSEFVVDKGFAEQQISKADMLKLQNAQ
ncbi:MAG: AAA family ATPase, partial [Paludibacteraceae bacterium]|nr:AAA family ATPase [Paludibacteraceae bacterium]